jgi:site-specific DNA recombinase
MARTARPRRIAAHAADDQPRRVAIYIRRSTDEEHQPFSLEAQETKLRAFVSSQPGEWQIVAVYTDDASGATLDRPGLTRALQEAKLGRFDTLLVYRVDRFSRRLRDMVTLLDELDDTQVTFRSATEPFDTATPVGRMVIQLLGVFAEFEREVIIDRVINGMERKAAKGKWLGGPRPYGYHHNPQTDALIPDQAEAAVITRVFDLYTRRRLGTRAIANQLNEQGLRTRRGKPWSGRTIQIMLTNRGYLGETSFRDITVADAHDAIIDPDVFDLAGRILAERGDTIGRRAANPSDYDLTGLIICPQCGRKYIGTNATGRNRTYRSYTCFSRQRYGTNAGCDAHPFNADALDAAIREALIEFYTTGDDLIAQAVAEFQQAHQDSHADLRRELAGVDKERVKTQAAIDRYLTAFEAGTMAPDICQPRLAELAERAKQLRTRHAELTADLAHPPAAPSPAELRQVREHIRDILAHGTPQERKSLYEALIDHIEITSDDTIVPVYRVPMTAIPDGPAPDRPGPAASGANHAVRALVTTVGGTGIEPVTSSV